MNPSCPSPEPRSSSASRAPHQGTAVRAKQPASRRTPWPRLCSGAACALLCLTAACGESKPSADGGTGVAPSDPCRPPPEPAARPTLHTPRWAFEPWISKDISSAEDTRRFVAGFRERDIPVGAVVLDSPWQTHYNTFVPNPSRYPDFEQLVADLHAQDVRVVLWVTQMVNVSSYDLEPGGDAYEGPSPNFQEGLDCGFYVDEGATYTWWKGAGAGVDFFDEHAVNWWRAQQRWLLDTARIDGWKLDFGEEYLRMDPLLTERGEVSRQEYSEAYYEDFLAFGQTRRGRDFVTMVRAYDESYGFSGRFFARPEHAPVAWMGDNRRDWVGLADALDHLFRSAAAGYLNIGSDIGGYLDRDDRNLLGPSIPFDPDNFARWVAVGAMTPFMQLHGRANLEPWAVPERAAETVEIYRYWATLHSELVPFFYSLVEEGSRIRNAGGTPEPVVRPVGPPASWPGDYRFHVGDAFLVAPILDGTGTRTVELPAGGEYADWWSLGGGGPAGTTLLREDGRIPIYLKRGALVPLAVRSELTGNGSAHSSGALTLLAWPAPEPSRFVLHGEPEGDGGDAPITLMLEATSDGASLALSRNPRPLVVKLLLPTPAAVRASGVELPRSSSRAELLAGSEGWFHDGNWLWVRTGAGVRAVQATLP